MSIYSNSVINTIDLPWKVFVRGNDEPEPEKPPKKFVSELNFSGNEAKRIYDEIICNQQESKHKNISKKREPGDKKTTNLSLSLQSGEKKSVTLTSNNSKAQNISNSNITVNSIMKAIEQRDMTYLENNIHSGNVNSTDTFGWTPLMLAAYCGFVEIVDFLLQSGANKKCREKSGLTAAQLALKKNYLDIVALLRKNNSIPENDSIHFEDLNINIKHKNVVEETDKDQVEDEEIKFYCDVCKGEFKSSSHENSIIHLFNSKSKFSSTLFSISRANKGYQMLLNTGWDEEHGLGRDGKGQKFPVKTVLKVDRKGLGMPTKMESRITHFKPGDVNAVKTKLKIHQAKFPTKKDREKLLSREARKERALRIALS